MRPLLDEPVRGRAGADDRTSMPAHRPHTSLLAVLALALCAMVAIPVSASARTQQRADFSASTSTAGKKASKAKSAGDCGDASVRAGESSADSQANSTVCLINRERTSRGLRELQLNSRLSSAAQAHTSDMVRDRYFAHNSRSGGDVVDRVRSRGYLSNVRSWMVGENLAWGSGTRSTPRSIVDAWMNSPGHRRNILTGRFREIGIGVIFRAPVSVSGNSAVTYTATFGSRG